MSEKGVQKPYEALAGAFLVEAGIQGAHAENEEEHCGDNDHKTSTHYHSLLVRGHGRTHSKESAAIHGWP